MRSPSIKKVLREAGLYIPSMQGYYEISSEAIEVHVGQEEYWVPCKEVYVDPQAEFVEAVSEAMAAAGYKLYARQWGYGGVEFTERAPIDMGDWNDPSSRWHY